MKEKKFMLKKNSLTAEFCQGRDGPVLFGDDENGYVMSYMFKLRDSQARGEARFYSLMILMTDRVYLISCWPFLVRWGLMISLHVYVSHSWLHNSAFRSMALNLQERANIIFQKEKESSRHSSYYSSTTRRTPISSQDPFFRRKSNTALRSLVDLLGIKVRAKKKQWSEHTHINFYLVGHLCTNTSSI